MCHALDIFAARLQPSEAARAALAVVRCLCVWPAGSLSVTFVYCVETAKDTAIAVWNANAKPYPSFRTVPFSMTLSDP